MGGGRDRHCCLMQKLCSLVSVARGCQAHQQKGYSSQREHADVGQRETKSECFLQYLPLLGSKNEVLSYLWEQETGRMIRVPPIEGATCEHTFVTAQSLKYGSKDSTLTKVL